MNEFLLISPVLSVSVLAIVAILLDAINPKNTKLGFSFALIALITSLGFSVLGLNSSQEWLIGFDSANSLTNDTLSFAGYTYFYDILFSISAIFTLLASKPYLTRENLESSEYYNLILFAVAGMMMIAHTKHMFTTFVGIETMSVTFYIMAGYFRFNKKSVESALKYFLLGAFATGFLVYGMAMIYGATGSFHLTEIRDAIASGDVSSWLYLKLGLGLIIVGLSFKIAAFPFHQWAPDVYSGSPTVVTAFMSTAGKAAAVIAFIIIATSLMPVTEVAEVVANTENAQVVIAVISALTMLIGNISALLQKNVKRMLAFSSVAHAGYLLMGIVANSSDGFRGMTFYITAYLFMQIGSFVIVSVLEREKEKNVEFSDYRGLWKSNPWLAAIMAIFMFSLAGLPPMAGFFGKYLLFAATLKAGFVSLVIVAVISSIISM
ncbi:NADH-quinone oxidoreductase subunit N, partial [Candidatus Kapabacteria bacterium]|nr:NADH-quinone oxidoreductase subunit N [Candidatus Kapabacteria bacterium]